MTIFFRERDVYTVEDIAKKMGISVEDAEKKIGVLCRYGIVKNNAVKSDFIETDAETFELENNPKESYYFNYVGAVAFDDCAFVCFPKYMEASEEQIDKLKTVVTAIRRYKSKEERLHQQDINEELLAYNKLGLCLRILYDYLENGLYLKDKDVLEVNGEGEIEWDRTIEDSFVYIKNSRPYYLDLYTRCVQNDDEEFIKKIHQCIVEECYNYLHKFGLNYLFDIPKIESFGLKRSSLGNDELLLHKIRVEQKNQFISHKQFVLKLMYAYINGKKGSKGERSLSLYGTTSLHVVWEKACGEIFNNQFDRKEIILEKPKWSYNGQSYELGDLIPDTLSEMEIKNERVLCILDGKYYTIVEQKKTLSGTPGVEDVVKQFIYHMALRKYMKQKGIQRAFNAFLLPNLDDDSENIVLNGEIKYMEFGNSMLSPVNLIFLKPDFVWNRYIQGCSAVELLKKCTECAQ